MVRNNSHSCDKSLSPASLLVFAIVYPALKLHDLLVKLSGLEKCPVTHFFRIFFDNTDADTSGYFFLRQTILVIPGAQSLHGVDINGPLNSRAPPTVSA